MYGKPVIDGGESGDPGKACRGIRKGIDEVQASAIRRSSRSRDNGLPDLNVGSDAQTTR